MKKLLAALTLTSLVACGQRETTSSRTAALDLKASHCEVFVDKVRLNRSSHGFLGATFYIKILRDRLDSDVVSVGFYGKHDYVNHYGDKVEGAWTFHEGKRFLGAQDYFEVKDDLWSSFVVSADYSRLHSWRGAFYAETSHGTRYWINPAGGGDFWVDYDAISPLRDRAEAHMLDLRNVESTADRLPYYNPSRCR